MSTLSLQILTLTLIIILSWAHSEPIQDKQTLLSFLFQVPHATRLQWDPSTSACTWTGVVCSPNNSSILTLRLPGLGLMGPIPSNTLGSLSQLRVLSLRSNALSGQLPVEFSNLTSLRALYLQKNSLSGLFPVQVTQLDRLTRLDLSSNNFSGLIPLSVNNLTKLTSLFLQNNRFSGQLPSINPKNLTNFNVSNNNLNGSIPKVLSKFGIDSFSGNLDLCGEPLPPCKSFFPPASTSAVNHPPAPEEGKKSKYLSTAAIVLIAVGAALFVFLIILLFFFLCRRRKKLARLPKATAVARELPIEISSSKDDITGGSSADVAAAAGARNKLIFLGVGKYSFDLEDLLRASAEVLGKGSVGTSYKAVLEEGTTVVVKRLKEVAVSQKEFEAQMETLGKVKHENIVALRAFYFSKDEKLLIYDFFPSGSLSSLLHGKLSKDGY